MGDESSSHATNKSKSFEAIITAVNIIAMATGIAAATIAANKSKTSDVNASRIEKSVGELSGKFDKISEQLKSLQPAKIEAPSTSAKESEKKPDGATQQQQSRPKQDVIYVRKASEFSFYN